MIKPTCATATIKIMAIFIIGFKGATKNNTHWTIDILFFVAMVYLLLPELIAWFKEI